MYSNKWVFHTFTMKKRYYKLQDMISSDVLFDAWRDSTSPTEGQISLNSVIMALSLLWFVPIDTDTISNNCSKQNTLLSIFQQ